MPWRYKGCFSHARRGIDIYYKLIIDINTSPGMTETSLIPKAWGYLDRSFDDLVEKIIKGASLKT
jgi:D-alanine-D-alanine ligase-like ATP-grasp enzyme